MPRTHVVSYLNGEKILETFDDFLFYGEKFNSQFFAPQVAAFYTTTVLNLIMILYYNVCYKYWLYFNLSIFINWFTIKPRLRAPLKSEPNCHKCIVQKEQIWIDLSLKFLFQLITSIQNTAIKSPSNKHLLEDIWDSFICDGFIYVSMFQKYLKTATLQFPQYMNNVQWTIRNQWGKA